MISLKETRENENVIWKSTTCMYGLVKLGQVPCQSKPNLSFDVWELRSTVNKAKKSDDTKPNKVLSRSKSGHMKLHYQPF